MDDCEELRQAINDFIDSRWAAGRRPATIAFYRDMLAKELMRFARRRRLGWPVTTDDLRDLLSYKRDQGRKTVTLQGYYRALSALFNWLQENGRIDDNPVKRLAKPTLPREIPRAIDKAALKTFFDAIAAQARADDRLAIRDRAMFELLYDAGLRASELLRLRLEDLDMTEQSAQVRGKGGHERVVYFGRWAAGCLKAWLAVRQVGGIYVFLSNKLDPMPLTRSGLHQRLRHWQDIADVPHFRTHDFRHSCATHLLRAGVDIEHVQRQLGHCNLSVTAKYLTADDRARKAAYGLQSPGDRLAFAPA